MRTTIVSNFFLAAFLKLSMKHIIKLINALQIVTLNPLLTIQMPSNYFVCLQTIVEISNLKLIPKEAIAWIYQRITGNEYENALDDIDSSLTN